LDLVFHFLLQIQNQESGVESGILNPKNTWDDKETYDKKAGELVKLFKDNFVKYENFGDYAEAGPV
jgi:phosphoenolpyruvate carboxykinase (ATP)